MSGRVKWRRDGQMVTGYRKTDRRNRRRVAATPAEYRLVFQLPAELAWSTRPGKVNSFVEVDAAGVVTVSSGRLEITQRKAREFVLAITGSLDVSLPLPPAQRRAAASPNPQV